MMCRVCPGPTGKVQGIRDSSAGVRGLHWPRDVPAELARFARPARLGSQSGTLPCGRKSQVLFNKLPETESWVKTLSSSEPSGVTRARVR